MNHTTEATAIVDASIVEEGIYNGLVEGSAVRLNDNDQNGRLAIIPNTLGLLFCGTVSLRTAVIICNLVIAIICFAAQVACSRLLPHTDAALFATVVAETYFHITALGIAGAVYYMRPLVINAMIAHIISLIMLIMIMPGVVLTDIVFLTVIPGIASTAFYIFLLLLTVIAVYTHICFIDQINSGLFVNASSADGVSATTVTEIKIGGIDRLDPNSHRPTKPCRKSCCEYFCCNARTAALAFDTIGLFLIVFDMNSNVSVIPAWCSVVLGLCFICGRFGILLNKKWMVAIAMVPYSVFLSFSVLIFILTVVEAVQILPEFISPPHTFLDWCTVVCGVSVQTAGPLIVAALSCIAIEVHRRLV